MGVVYFKFLGVLEGVDLAGLGEALDFGVLTLVDVGVLSLLTFSDDFKLEFGETIALGVLGGGTFDGFALIGTAFDFFADCFEDKGAFRAGVAFTLEGVFLPTLDKTVGVFAFALRLIMIVSGDLA